MCGEYFTVVQDGGVSHGPSLSDSRAKASIFRGQGGPGGGLTSRPTPAPHLRRRDLGMKAIFSETLTAKHVVEKFFFSICYG